MSRYGEFLSLFSFSSGFGFFFFLDIELLLNFLTSLVVLLSQFCQLLLSLLNLFQFFSGLLFSNSSLLIGILKLGSSFLFSCSLGLSSNFSLVLLVLSLLGSDL